MIVGLLIGLGLAGLMIYAAQRIDEVLGCEDDFWRGYDD